MAQSNVGDLVVSLDVDSVRFSNQMAAARSQLGGFGKDAESATNYLETMKHSALGLTGILAGGITATSLIKTADEWGQLSSRMAMATGSASELGEAQRRLMEISDRTYKPIEEQAELFIRNASAMRELGYSTSEAIDYIDSISSSLTINAASAQRAESAINALSKATVAGKVSGQNWNTILGVMPTIAGDIARHLGTTETAVKQLAASGKLSFKDFSDAVIAAREENARLAEEMPTTVGDAITRLSNHWKAYVGDANAATGATATLASGINLLTDNLDTIVTLGEALAVGMLSKYFLSASAAAITASKSFLTTRASTISLAQAQLQAAQTVQYKATIERRAAEAAASYAAAGKAQREASLALVIARNREAAAINAVTAAQTRLNTVSSLAARAGSALLGVMGGLPGIIALGGAAMYGLYQHQENARQSAREYGETINQIAEKIESMKLPEAWDSEGKTREALKEQNRQITEQENKVRDLQTEIAGLQQIMQDPGPTVGGFMINHLMSMDSATKQLADTSSQLSVEQSRLSELQNKAVQIQTVLSDLEYHRVGLIRDEAAEQNRLYQSQLMMNGAYASFNSVLSAGNILLRERSDVRSPLMLPQSELSEAQQRALDVAARNRELAGLKGAERARRQAEFSAEDLGLTGPENQRARQQLIDDTIKATELQEELKTSVKKTADPYADILKSQQRQLALYGETTEQAKIQYELTRGDLSSLSESQKMTLARNATELDRLAAMDRFKSLTDDLRTSEEKALDIARERVKILNDANISAEEYAQIMGRITQDMIVEMPKFGGIDASISGAAGELFKTAEAEKELQEWYSKQLEMLAEFYAEKEGMGQEHADRIAQIDKQMTDRQEQIQQASTSAMLSIYGDFTSGAVDLLQTMGQESSAIYKAMFLASKAVSIAQAIINIEVAATKALAEGGAVMGIPLSTMIRAAGYASVALMTSTTLAGMAHDGIDYVPNEGTWLLAKGERVVDSRTNEDLKSFLSAGGSTGGASDSVPEITQIFNLYGNGDDALAEVVEEAAMKGAALARQEMLTDFQNRGPARRLLDV